MELFRSNGFSSNKDFGWTPVLWLVYLVFLFIQPYLDHEGWKRWTALALVCLIFLPLYSFAYMTKGRRRDLALFGIALLGFVYLPFNSGALTFFIYAAALIPFATSSAGSALTLIVAELATVALECRWLRLPAGSWLIPVFIGGAIGVGNIFFAQQRRSNSKLRMAQDEIEHLAKIAERERIARDLHDVLGHTLSMVVLKSELAGRLLDLEPTRAAAEIRDVEQTARKALAEVREAVRGYRSEGFAAEVQRAQRTLELAGVEAECDIAAAPMTPATDTVLSLALREAVTNIVRHAGARHCLLKLVEVNDSCCLMIEDDGRGGPLSEGNGLRGMRERIESLGGSFACETGRGTRLQIRLPLNTRVVVTA